MTLTYKKPHIPDLSHVLRGIGEIASEIVEEEVESFAVAERDSFVRRIKRQEFQSFNATPLTRLWLRRKIMARADKRVMIATGHYIRSIKIQRRRVGRRGRTIFVGFDSRLMPRDLDGRIVHVEGGMNKIAWVHERGSAKMKVPPRPHWEPHRLQMVERARGVRKRIKRRIGREARSRFGAVLRRRR